jgi:hypothetical protein
MSTDGNLSAATSEPAILPFLLIVRSAFLNKTTASFQFIDLVGQ